jgi:hypothetical protein
MTIVGTDVIHFELPDHRSAVRLAARLDDTWALQRTSAQIPLVSVQLRPEPNDLALLLRAVERWVAERSLIAIRYEVDEHEYVLAAGGSQWDAVPAIAI